MAQFLLDVLASVVGAVVVAVLKWLRKKRP
jgi:hypothetical protein